MTRTVYVDANDGGASASPADPTNPSTPYNSILNCEAGERGTLTEALEIILADGTWNENTAITFSDANWTTTATNKITIKPETNFGTTINCTSNTYADIITVSGDVDIEIQDFLMDHQGSLGTFTHGCIHAVNAGVALVQRMIMRGAGYVVETSGSVAGQATVKNSVIIANATNASAHAARVGFRSDFRHNTVIHLGTSANAIEVISSVLTNVEYCYAHSAGGSGYNGTAATKTAILTSDATGDTGSVDYTTTNFTNVTTDTEDLSLVSGSDLIAEATSSTETEDLLGNSRDATEDCGAYEFISAGQTELSMGGMIVHP